MIRYETVRGNHVNRFNIRSVGIGEFFVFIVCPHRIKSDVILSLFSAPIHPPLLSLLKHPIIPPLLLFFLYHFRTCAQLKRYKIGLIDPFRHPVINKVM